MQQERQKAGVTGAYVIVTCLFFAWGFITSNTDPLIAAMRGIYTLNVAEGMLTQFAFFVAYFVMSMPAAALLGRLGHSRTIIGALMVMVGACLLMLVASHIQAYAMVLVALFVMASGITALQVAANPLAASLGKPEYSHFRLTLAQAFNSLGVVLGVQIGSKLMLRQDVFGQGGHILPNVERGTALGAIDHAFVLIAVAVLALSALIFAFRRNIDTSASHGEIANASPMWIAATWRTKIGMPFSAPMTICSISLRRSMSPSPRMTVQVPFASTTLPPTLRLLRITASTTAENEIRKARRRLGSTSTWYCRTTPPTLATSATPGTAFS